MQDQSSIKYLGRAQTFKYVSFGLLTALLMIWGICTAIDEPIARFISSLNEIGEQLIVGFMGLLLGAYFLGGHASHQIIVKGKSPQFVGVYTSLLILILGITSGSLVFLFEDGLVSNAHLYRNITSYILTPLIVILVFGFIPTTILGTFLGRSIKKLGSYKL